MRKKQCTKFFSTSGCPYGDRCHFLHSVPVGGVAALGLSASLANTGSGSSSGISGGGANNSCKVLGGSGLPAQVSLPGDQGPSSSVAGFKTRLCNKFDTPEGCRYGEKCHFAHTEKELRKFNTVSADRDSSMDLYSPARSTLGCSQVTGCGPQNGAPVLFQGEEGRTSGGGARGRGNGRGFGVREGSKQSVLAAAAESFATSFTAKICVEASVAGAIIGKGGVSAKQISRLTGAKLCIREHETDAALRNVEMEGSFEQIKQASQMVRQMLMQQRDHVVSPVKHTGFDSPNFKTKMCEYYLRGPCPFGDRCNFAHGTHEMRDHALRA